MSYSKTIVCLANSSKSNEACVAGKVIESGNIREWLRPVSSRTTQEISKRERSFKNGSEISLLDIVTIGFEKPIQVSHQSENHLIEAGIKWEKIGIYEWANIPKLVDNPDTLWSNSDSSKHGLNNRLTVEEAKLFNCSLYLVYVDKVELNICPKAPQFGDMKRIILASFKYKNCSYRIDVKDPYFYQRDDGKYITESAYLCISLTEPYKKDGLCYKIIAAIFYEERFK